MDVNFMRNQRTKKSGSRELQFYVYLHFNIPLINVPKMCTLSLN